MVVKKDETGKVSEARVPQKELAEHIRLALESGIEVLAVIRLP